MSHSFLKTVPGEADSAARSARWSSLRSVRVLAGLLSLYGLGIGPVSLPVCAQEAPARSGLMGTSGFSRGPGRRSMLDGLGNETTRSELAMTPEQQQKLNALSESLRSNGGIQFGDFRQRLQAAQSEEDRNQIRAEMSHRFEELQKQTDAQVKEILTPAQVERLEELRLQREGPMALVREPELATEFGLSEAQKEQLQKLTDERMSSWFGMRGASEEERQHLRDEWNQKYMAVLTPEQQERWTKRLGAPVASVTPTGTPASAAAASPESSPAMVSGTPVAAPAAASPSASSVAPAAADPSKANSLSTNEPVVSFRSTESGTEKTSSAASGSENTPGGNSTNSTGEKKFSFNFRYAPWGDVLRLFAAEAGLSLDLNALPPGTFNYYDQGRYTPTEALDILNGYLLPKGYCLVRRDDFLVCLNIDQPIPPSLIPVVGPDELDQRGKNELLTVIFPLEGVDVEQVAAEVNDIKGPQGKVVGLKTINSVLVMDIGSNLRRVRDLLIDVTARGGPNDVTFKAYPLQNIPVSDAEVIVRSLLGLSTGVTNVSSNTEDRRRDLRDPRSSRDSRDSRSAPVPGDRSASTVAARITIDGRTNQLLVTATLAQHQLVEQTLKTIDVAGDPSQFSPTSTRPYLKVYTVSSSDAREVTKTIDALMPGIVVNEDARNRKVHILASPEQHRQVETLIAQMDGLGGAQQMAVIPLSTLDPMSVAGTLRSMFSQDGTSAPTVEADLYGRQIMVRGTVEQLAQVRALLNQLGEDGTGQSARTGQGRIRTLQLGGRDPAELIPMLERMWNTRDGSSIRVTNPPGTRRPGSIVPSTQESPGAERPSAQRSGTGSAVPSVRTFTTVRRTIPLHLATQTQSDPSHTQDDSSQTSRPDVSQETGPATPDASKQSDGSQVSGSPKTSGGSKTSGSPNASDSDVEAALEAFLKRAEAAGRREAGDSPSGRPGPSRSGQKDSAADPADGNTADVNITVMGDELIITSSDPEQLNELERLLSQAMQALPPRITWTVYPLQAADATEAANMLKLLFPGSTVTVSSSSTSSGMLGALGGSAASLGSSLMDAAGLNSLASTQQLRMIPDTRLNALFVAGPAAQVNEVEEMLKVLDSTGLGADSLRDKMSRIIPVNFADAQDVYGIVKEVYKNYIDPPRTSENVNPLAMLAAGRGGRNGAETPPPAAKLAIGVDTNTSQLIVWADEPLFREIETLVQSLDQAAEEARRTIRVIPLENTNSAVMQTALGSLIPRIKISTTGSRPSTTSTPSSGTPIPSPSASGGSSDRDRMRQFFEQRMRDGGGFGGRGGSDGSSRGFGGRGFGGRSPGSGDSGGFRGGRGGR